MDQGLVMLMAVSGATAVGLAMVALKGFGLWLKHKSSGRPDDLARIAELEDRVAELEERADMSERLLGDKARVSTRPITRPITPS